MKRKNLSKFSFVLIISFLLLITPILEANAESYKLKTTDAGYDDLDDDGITDDVFVNFNLVITFDDDEDKEQYGEFLLLFFLELPSGKNFYFSWLLILKNQFKTLHFTIHALNTAVESGWYTSHLYLYEFHRGNYYFEDYDSLVFDPPGGGNGEPVAILTLE